jgi:threonine dehydratase
MYCLRKSYIVFLLQININFMTNTRVFLCAGLQCSVLVKEASVLQERGEILVFFFDLIRNIITLFSLHSYIAVMPTLADIRAAHQRIKPHINHTPVLTSHTLNEITGGTMFFKCENFQKIGAFKARGAFNAVFSLTDAEAAKGVATHSSGNHAAALALAAKTRGCTAHVVMPDNAPLVKKQAVERYGGRITFCEPTLESRETTLARIVAETNANVIHPFDDVRVICGQGTATIELIEDVLKESNQDLDLMLAPVGGGGLLSGTAIAATSLVPSIHVIACEPELAGDAAISFREKKIAPPMPPVSIADGLRTALSPLTFGIMQQRVSDVVTVTEASIIQAMRLTWEVMKIIIEPSCAVPLAAIMERKVDVRGKRVGIILTGGNVDLERLPWQME